MPAKIEANLVEECVKIEAERAKMEVERAQFEHKMEQMEQKIHAQLTVLTQHGQFAALTSSTSSLVVPLANPSQFSYLMTIFRPWLENLNTCC